MTHDQITHHLNRWQKVMQAVDEKMSALCALTGDTDGPLPRAIGELQEKYTRLLTEHLGWDSDALQDWWLEHEFGASPMQAGFEGEGMREIRDNADLARFIHDDKARSSGMTECEKLRKDAERWRYVRQFLSLDDVGDEEFCLGLVVDYEGLESAVTPHAARLHAERCAAEWVVDADYVGDISPVPPVTMSQAIDAALAAHRKGGDQP